MAATGGDGGVGVSVAVGARVSTAGVAANVGAGSVGVSIAVGAGVVTWSCRQCWRTGRWG